MAKVVTQELDELQNRISYYLQRHEQEYEDRVVPYYPVRVEYQDLCDWLNCLDRARQENNALRAALWGLMGGMNSATETHRGTEYRGGFHTEAMYQEAVRALQDEA